MELVYYEIEKYLEILFHNQPVLTINGHNEEISIECACNVGWEFRQGAKEIVLGG